MSGVETGANCNQPTLNKMTDLQKQIEELEKIKSLENPYDWKQAKSFNKSQEEWFYYIQQCMAKEALSIIKQLQEEIKQLKGENNEK